jgi:hypothetical protein
MSFFQILDSPDENYKKIVVRTTYESLSNYLSEISNLLSIKCIQGKIVFDYFLTGQTQTRFFEIEFDRQIFDYSSLRNIQVSNAILETVTNFYNANYLYIENSLLSEPLKFQYKQPILWK